MVAAKRGARPARARKSSTQARENPESLEAEIPEIEITNLGSFDESTNILVYGPSGHGKTALVGGAPRATFMSTEKGVVAAQIAGHKAKLMRAPTWEHCLAAMNKADETLGKDDWLIPDSITKMQVLYLRWILKTIHEHNSSRDLDIPAIQDHQKWQNGFKRFIDHMIDAQYNTIFVATAMIKDDEDGDEIVMPDLTGKNYAISSYIQAQMDVTLYYAVSKQASTSTARVRRALAQPYPPYIAKDRYNALGMYQDVQDGDYGAMAEFIEMIQSAKAAAKAEAGQ